LYVFRGDHSFTSAEKVRLCPSARLDHVAAVATTIKRKRARNRDEMDILLVSDFAGFAIMRRGTFLDTLGYVDLSKS
jgi:hypothetical protein